MGMHVAVIGGGFVGRVHLEAMLDHAAVRAVSLAEADGDARAELAGRYSLDRSTTDYRALLDDPSVDIVDVCLPHDLHHPVVLEAFAAGKHVIADKPIANTLLEADEMLAAAEAAGRRFFVALNERFLPVHQRVGELLAEGFLGQPSLAQLVVAGSELPRLRLARSLEGHLGSGRRRRPRRQWHAPCRPRALLVRAATGGTLSPRPARRGGAGPCR